MAYIKENPAKDKENSEITNPHQNLLSFLALCFGFFELRESTV